MDQKRFKQQLAFTLELDKEKNVLRQTHLSGNGRRENDAEHAWHMAIMAYLLREYANEPIDIAKTILMTLLHDVVEIDAGDTYVYDAEARKTQREREEKAAKRLFGLLPEDQEQELRALFEEFEAGETPEARFARAMDSLQPFLLIHSNNGADWRERGNRRSQIMERQCMTRPGSEEIWRYICEQIEEHVAKGNLEDA